MRRRKVGSCSSESPRLSRSVASARIVVPRFVTRPASWSSRALRSVVRLAVESMKRSSSGRLRFSSWKSRLPEEIAGFR